MVLNMQKRIQPKMKITKSDLAQIIKEELSRLNENPNEIKTAKPKQKPVLGKDRTTAGTVTKNAASDARLQAARGITDEERGLIKRLNVMLVNIAGTTNITTGIVMQKIRALAKAIEAAPSAEVTKKEK